MVRKMKFAMPALALAFALAFAGCSNDIGYDENWSTFVSGTPMTAAQFLTATGAGPAPHPQEYVDMANAAVAPFGGFPVNLGTGFIGGGFQGPNAVWGWTGRSEHQMASIIAWIESDGQYNANDVFIYDYAVQSAEGSRDWTVNTTNPGGVAMNIGMNFRRGVPAAAATPATGRTGTWEIWYTAAGGMFDSGGPAAQQRGIIVQPGTVILIMGGLAADPAGTGAIGAPGGGAGPGPGVPDPDPDPDL